LLSRNVGDTREARQGTKSFLFTSTGDADTTRLSMGVVERLIDGVDWTETTINIGKLGNPLITRLTFENSAQRIHRLLALVRAKRPLEGQQFKVADTRAESVPEFGFERGKRDMLAITGLVDVVTGKPTVERGM